MTTKANSPISEEMLMDYALGMLSEGEARAVEDHLQNDPAAALLVKSYLNALSAIVLTEEPEALPEDAEDKLLEAIRNPHATQAEVISLPPKDSWNPKPWWLALAVAAVLALITWVSILNNPNRQINQALQQAQSQQGAISQSLVNDKQETIGTLVKQADNSLLVIFKEKPPPAQVYQAWEIVNGVPVSLGVWNDRLMKFESLTEGSIFGVTLEPPSGSEQPTSTPIVLFQL